MINQAVITLLPKNDEKEKLKNWRPITLLSSVYKILTRILANRLKPTLEHLISIEKAFDKVDTEFLHQIMQKLGYSEIFIKFIKKLYQNTLSALITASLLPPSPYLEE